MTRAADVARRYVVRKNPDMNAVYVSRSYHGSDKVRDTFVCDSFNWLANRPADIALHGAGTPHAAGTLYVKVRHGERMYECKAFQSSEDGASALVVLSDSDQGLAAGQYAVFYNDEGVCLGSAVMQGSVPSPLPPTDDVGADTHAHPLSVEGGTQGNA